MKKRVLNIVVYLVGINILSLGTVLFTCCKLGASALVTVPQVINLIFPLSLGGATTVVFLLFVTIEFFIVRKIKLIILLQFPLSFVFGWLVDFYDITLGMNQFVPESYLLKAITLILALLCTSIGIFMMLKSDGILIPPDGLVSTIAIKINKTFGQVKLYFDISMILTSTLLSIFYLGKIITVGLGTILAILTIGRMVNFWSLLWELRVKKNSAC